MEKKKKGKNVFGTENQSSAFRQKSHETKSGLSLFLRYHLLMTKT